MRELIFLKPVLKERIWGGSRLSEFGYELPSDSIGECWGISAHPKGDCEIRGGSFEGLTLSSLWENHRELFGGSNSKDFPLLIKILCAKTDLSIQVHPDDAYANVHENGSIGKNECWYILDSERNASVVIGHNAETEEEARQMMAEGRWKDFLRERRVKKGDFYSIPCGTIHSIKAGTMIFETQQNCDITYRLYDYDRLQNGKPRTLNVEKCFDMLSFPYIEDKPERTVYTVDDCKCERLIACPFYTVEHLQVDGDASFETKDTFLAMSVVEGEGNLDGVTIRKGDHFLIPFGYGEYHISGKLEIMMSYV